MLEVMRARKITPRENGDDTVPKKFEHKRSLGQNFLTSNVVPNWMAQCANIEAGDTVLEIGPGTGRLTSALLERKANVIAIEADARAIVELEALFPAEITSGQLVVHHGDAREITPQTLGLTDKGFKVVANIPYYLSGFLLRTLLESDIQPTTLTFLIQKELAFRIARDTKESLLSLSVKAFGNPHYNRNVGRGHFHPIPNVDSAILTITDISKDNFKTIEPKLFFEILHLGLGKKRKQLLANLASKYSRGVLAEIFDLQRISRTARGEDLVLSQWLALTEALSHT